MADLANPILLLSGHERPGHTAGGRSLISDNSQLKNSDAAG
jgi:hypothetical protein